MERDVVLTAYACSAAAPCTKWAHELFTEGPLVISIPGSGETFARKGKQWTATGDAFKAAISELCPQYRGITIRRRALVSFSFGWQFGDELLKSPRERSLLDAYLLEDGLHTRGLDHWIDYATRAANAEALMLMAHSLFKSSGVSSRETNTDVFRRAKERNDQDSSAVKLTKSLPDYLAKPSVPEDGWKVTVGATRDTSGMITTAAYTKVWDSDPLALWENRGNLWRLEYAGNDRPDHLFIAKEVAYRMWQMLASRWA